jgi:hypothetical protein
MPSCKDKSDTLYCLERLPSLGVYRSFMVPARLCGHFYYPPKYQKKANWPNSIPCTGGESMDKLPVSSTNLSPQEQKLIEMVRTLEYGQLTITVKAGLPIHVEEIRKSIPLK